MKAIISPAFITLLVLIMLMGSLVIKTGEFESATAQSCCIQGSPPSSPPCYAPNNWRWYGEPDCYWSCEESPIIIDMNNDGYNLTSTANGVSFDLQGMGVITKWSWTSGHSDEAFLALDRNGDRKITSGKELFGSVTEQPVSEEPNGFLALAVFDKNNDRWIDRNDLIYEKLLLWEDSNHDGVSQPSELQFLRARNVKQIGLDYKVSKRTDRYGNRFLYRAPVLIGQERRWAWDVFLRTIVKR
jgi:hypothetical protein